MKKLLTIFFIVLIILSFSGKCIKIRTNRGHYISTHLHFKFSSLMHMKHCDSRDRTENMIDLKDLDENSPQFQFFLWMMSDRQLAKSAIKGEKLSTQNAGKIRQYLLDHPQVIDAFIKSQNCGENSCIDQMNRDQKTKLYGWVLEQFDFTSVFEKDGQMSGLTDQQNVKIREKVESDEQLKKIFENCID